MSEYLIGIDVGGTNTKILLTDTSFSVIGERMIPTRLDLPFEEYTDSVNAAIDDCFSKAGIEEKRVRAVGMGLPGLVDHSKIETILLPLHRWNGMNPCERIADYFGAESFLDNDANINALGEYYFGEGKKYKDIILLTVGTGLGGAAICDGKLLRGKHNAAMEVGHMTIYAEGGRPCVCGNKGCLEPYCSGTAMARLAKEAIDSNPDSLLNDLYWENDGRYDNALVSKAAEQGDKAALEVIDSIAKYLGLGIANLQKIFNPDAVFIGGGVSNAGDLLLDPVRKYSAERVMHPSQDCPILRASLGMKSGMYGAAALAGLGIGLEPKRSVAVDVPV